MLEFIFHASTTAVMVMLVLAFAGLFLLLAVLVVGEAWESKQYWLFALAPCALVLGLFFSSTSATLATASYADAMKYWNECQYCDEYELKKYNWKRNGRME